MALCAIRPTWVGCRYNLLREDSEGWAKVMDVLNIPMDSAPSAAAISQTVRAFCHAMSCA